MIRDGPGIAKTHTTTFGFYSVVIARLVSTAGTGFMYTTRRTRVADKLSMMKYDPKGKCSPENLLQCSSEGIELTQVPPPDSPKTRPLQGNQGLKVNTDTNTSIA